MIENDENKFSWWLMLHLACKRRATLDTHQEGDYVLARKWSIKGTALWFSIDTEFTALHIFTTTGSRFYPATMADDQMKVKVSRVSTVAPAIAAAKVLRVLSGMGRYSDRIGSEDLGWLCLWTQSSTNIFCNTKAGCFNPTLCIWYFDCRYGMHTGKSDFIDMQGQFCFRSFS